MPILRKTMWAQVTNIAGYWYHMTPDIDAPTQKVAHNQEIIYTDSYDQFLGDDKT